MTILDKIIAHKKQEITERKKLIPPALLEQSIYYDSPVVSFSEFLKREDKQGIIAEFKRQSPSKGAINQYADIEEVSIGYMQAGASAISVLTDTHFFGGRNEDLTTARKFNYAPILNKNFIVDTYQIIEAKAIGADVILLIAECLSANEVKQFSALAKSLGLEVLLEVHTANQLSKITPDIDVIGINNRNLKTFEVDIENALSIAALLPQDTLRIAESGISKPKTVVELQEAGFDGFLIGECFMQDARPQDACRQFIQKIKQIKNDETKSLRHAQCL